MADTASALRKLQSGQPLTDAEKKLLGISVTPTKATLTQAEIDAKTAEQVAAGVKSTDRAARLPGETATQANARITQGYKDQPKGDLTQEGVAAGATLEYVRTAAGGVGEYKEVFPIGTPIPATRTTASGNTYDVKGNLISGTGTKTATTTTTTKVNPTLARGGSPGGTDDDGKEVFYGSVPGKEMTATYGFYYADGSVVPPTKLVNNAIAAEAANAGSDVGFGPGVSPAQSVYGKTLSGDTGLSVLKEDAPTYGDATYDPVNKIVIVRDFNGTSIYNEKGMLISGRGSVNPIGVAKGSAGLGAQIDINGVGAYGTPEYNRNIANAAKQNLAFAGSDLQSQAFGTFGTSATPFIVNGKPFTGISGGRNYVNGIATDGTTSSTTTLGVPDIGGGSEGATAFDVFKNTLSLFFGPSEMNKPWVNQVYKRVSGFTKSGSTPEEAFNMAVLESYNDPALADFTKRFKGIFALQKLKQEGKAVEVPTVAEYFKTQETMGNLLKSSNLGSLANEDYLGDVIGKAVSATEFSNRLVAVFDRIDNASDINKKTISRFFPTLDRTQLAKALLTGEKGAKQLQQELAGYEVLSAAEQQGLGVSPKLLGGITNEQAQQIAKGGGTYASTLGQFGQIAGARETEQKLAEISGVQSIGVGGLTSAVINKSAAELKKLEDLTRQEEARFAGKAGTAGSRALASQSRANRVI